MGLCARPFLFDKGKDVPYYGFGYCEKGQGVLRWSKSLVEPLTVFIFGPDGSRARISERGPLRTNPGTEGVPGGRGLYSLPDLIARIVPVLTSFNEFFRTRIPS